MLRFLSEKIRASSLMATLVIALIISTTCSLLLLTVYYSMLSSIKDEIDQRLTDNLSSGMRLLFLPRGDSSSGYIRDSSLLFTGQTDSIYYTNESWGCFSAAHIKVCYKGRSKESGFFYGSAVFRFNDASIYLADHGRALALTSDAYMQGKYYLPQSGLYNGFFQETGLSGQKILNGPVDTSSGQLPEILPACKTFFLQLAHANLEHTDTTAALPDTIHHSFSLSPRVVHLPSHALIAHQDFKGKLILMSDATIEVSGTAQLRDVILTAPYIRFNSGFKGTVQAFARDSIVVETGCYFEYPSALISNSGADSAAITIHRGSTINGLVLGIMEHQSDAKPIIKIKSGATVKGLIYSEGYTQLNGQLEGAVFTNFFLDQRGPAKEENLVTNATITPSRWFQKGAYSFIFKDATRQTVLKWLY